MTELPNALESFTTPGADEVALALRRTLGTSRYGGTVTVEVTDTQKMPARLISEPLPEDIAVYR
jgi:hypothetical protein